MKADTFWASSNNNNKNLQKLGLYSNDNQMDPLGGFNLNLIIKGCLKGQPGIPFFLNHSFGQWKITIAILKFLYYDIHSYKVLLGYTITVQNCIFF